MTNPLIHRFLEDPAGLDEQELDQLVALLRDDPRKAVELREQLLLDDHLSQKLAIDRQNFFAQIEQRITDFERGEEEMYDHVAELRAIAEGEIDKPLRKSPRAAWLKYSLAGGVALSLVVAIAAWQWTSSSPKAVANIEEISGDVTIVRGKEQIAPQVGKVVFTGDQVVSTVGSTIEWKYKDETTVRIVGDAVSFVTADRQSGAKQVKLDQGELIATVARQPRGPMVFSTPHATATVRGTQLRLVVGRADTQLDVSEGEVELTRLADGKKIDVAANETGVASAERIALRMPQWPVDRSRAVFLFDGADSLCRNPESGNFRHTPLEPQGSVKIGPRQTLLLEGGTFSSVDAGGDLHALLKQSGQYSLEIAFTPSNTGEDAKGAVLHFGGQAGTSLTLTQGGAFPFFGQYCPDVGFYALTLPTMSAGKRIHVIVTYDGNRLLAYVNGKAFGDALEQVPMPHWPDGPLTLGTTAPAGEPWHGEIVRLAIFAHAMDADEANREWKRFELVHP